MSPRTLVAAVAVTALAPILLGSISLSCGGDTPAATESDPSGRSNAATLPLSAAWRTELTPDVVALIDKHVERVERQPKSGEQHGTLGLVYRANRLWSEARDALTRATELAPDEPLWVGQLADALGELGERTEQLARLESGAAAFPEYAPTQQRLALLRLEQGDFEAARSLFQRVEGLAPKSPAGALGLGAALLELGRAAEAEPALRRALALSTNERSGHYLLGRALRDLGRPDEALQHLERGSGGRLEPMPDEAERRLVRFAIGSEHKRQRATRALAGGRPAEALAILEPLAAANPTDTRLLLDLGVAYSRLARPADALAQYRAALALEEDSHLVHANVAACLLELGRASEALTAADRTVELAPEQAQGHMMRGLAFAALGKNVEARTSLEHAAGLAPGDKQVKRALESLGTPPVSPRSSKSPGSPGATEQEPR